MVATTYTKSLATDFGGTINTDQLTTEIVGAAIAPNLVFITVDGDDVDIRFDDALSAGEQTTLDNVISAHVPVTVVETTKIVQIEEESVATGGHFSTETVAFDATASTTTTHNHSWPMKVSVMSVSINPVISDTAADSQEGDTFEISIAPDTTVGSLTVDAESGATVLDVQQSVVDNIKVGYWVTVTDGTNTDDCGRVLAVDTSAKTITVETATTVAFAAATPTYIKQTVKMVPSFEIGTGRITMGDDKIGCSSIPANTTARIKYTNNTANQKRARFNVEYLY